MSVPLSCRLLLEPVPGGRERAVCEARRAAEGQAGVQRVQGRSSHSPIIAFPAQQENDHSVT